MVADFKKKQKGDSSENHNIFQVVGIVFMVIIVVLAFSDIKIYQKKRELALQVANYKKQIAGIKENNQKLKAEIANSDNVDYLEKIAYEQLGQQKPGEQEVIFINPQKKADTAVKQQNFLGATSAWFSDTWGWIKSKF